jgi:hypothetical protein
MKRREFLASTLLTGAVLLEARTSLAAPKPAAKPTTAPGTQPETCTPGLDFVSAEATYFARYEHYHLLSIPVSALMNPPADGIKVRTSTLDQDSLDVEAFEKFIKETGLTNALRTHSHEVHFKQDELIRIANGEEKVEITVPTPKGNLAHRFYFTATKSALVKVKKARAARGE